MKMKIFLFVAIAACAFAAEESQTEKEDGVDSAQNKDKRQVQGEAVQRQQLTYRQARKQEHFTPVEESQEDDTLSTASNRAGTEQYRPGQVFSLNVQELLDLQPERKAPLASSQALQQLYSVPQQQHTENLQYYYLEPQTRQVTLQPSRTMILRPSNSANGGEASVGAALSVSDSGTSPSDSSFDEELLALLGQAPVRPEAYSQAPAQVSTQQSATQYQQIERYITKPTKKPTKLRSKVSITPPHAASTPQQYLIETTNVAQLQPKPQQQLNIQPQYRIFQQPAQRPTQAVRYINLQQAHALQQQIQQAQPVQQAQPIQQVYYPETQNQGLKIVAAPKLQQPRAQQLAYRFVPQYQQETSPKQFRLIDPRPQQTRVEQRVPASSVDRPVTYIKRFPAEVEKQRAVKFVEADSLSSVQRQPQVEQQYYLKYYRPTEQRVRYEVPQYAIAMEQLIEPTKPPHSSIYVNKNVAPKKAVTQPQYQPQLLKIEETVDNRQQYKSEQQKVEDINIEQHGQSIDERRAQLPPPRNNKAYTPEEFEALVAAGYSVTPVPVGSFQPAQSRSSIEAPVPPPRRPLHSRRNQYLPLRSDEAP